MASPLRFLLDPVRSRISALYSEIKIMDEQLRFVGRVPGTSKDDRNNLVMFRNIKTALHDAMATYCVEMEKVAGAAAPMHQIVSCHLYVMKTKELEIKLQTLYGQQSALTTNVGQDYQRVTNDQDESADRHLKMISLLYPYEFVVEILSNSEFVRLLLKTVIEYNVERHVYAVTAIFDWIKKFQAKSEAAKKNHFFTAQNPMCFLLAEQFVTMFVYRKMMKVDNDKLRNFSTCEKCALIAKQGATDCGVNPKLVQALKDRGVKELSDSEDSEYLTKVEQNELVSTLYWTESENEIENSEIPALNHIVLEMKKMTLHASPSSILSILSNAIQWLKASLREVTGQDPGADELLPPFVYCLTLSKPGFLPSMVEFVDKFVDAALKETAFLYYMEQLKTSLEFIEDRLLPVQPFVMLPFIEPPARLKDHIELVRDGMVTIKGFEVWAFPTYSEMSESIFPAMIRYTGKDIVARVYQFRLKDVSTLVKDESLELIPTLNGAFIQCSTSMITNHEMIRIDDGDFVNSELEVNVVSAMIKMLGGNVANPSVNVLQKMYDVVQRPWGLGPGDPRLVIPRLIAEVQKALVILEDLPSSFPIDGILNRKTWEAIVKRVKPGKSKLNFTPQVVEFLTSSMRKKMS